MKKAIFSTLLSLATATVWAQEYSTNVTTTTTTTTRTRTELTLADTPEMYRAPELSLDGFGSMSIGQQTIAHPSGDRIRHDARFGAGAGINFFFLRMVGIGGDVYSEDTHHNFIDKVSGNLIVRFPVMDTGFAPYIFGGGGYAFDQVPGKFAQGGAGLEFRFTQNIGIFVDGRYVLAHKIDNYGLGRAGLRIAF
jgi:hypothetical protein